MLSRNPFVVFALLACVFALGGCVGTFFGFTLPDDLRERGVAADAVILEIWDSGWTVNDDPVIGMRVRVTPADGAPFEGSIKRYLISRLAVSSYQPGSRLRVRYDPDDHSRLAVDDTASAASAVPPIDLARIHDPTVLLLQPSYAPPPLPAALHGLRVLVVDRVVGLETGGDLAAAEQGCRQTGVLLFDRIGWYMVHDAAEPHDLVVHADCSASVRFLTAADAVFALLPQTTTGMRISAPDGTALAELQPVPRTLRCPSSNTSSCAEAIKDFAVAHVINQIAHSEPLLRYVQTRGATQH